MMLKTAFFFMVLVPAVLSAQISIFRPKISTPALALTTKTTALGVPFIENQGQIEDRRVRFYARTLGGTVFVTTDGIVYALPKMAVPADSVLSPMPARQSFPRMTGAWSLHESVVGANIIAPARSGKWL